MSGESKGASGDGPNEPESSRSIKPKVGSGEHPLMGEARRLMTEFEETSLKTLQEAREGIERAMNNVPTLAPPTGRASEWVITIRGRGPHHTSDANDANRLAQQYIRDLREHGHDVVGAAFESDVPEDLTATPQAAAPEKPR